MMVPAPLPASMIWLAGIAACPIMLARMLALTLSHHAYAFRPRPPPSPSPPLPPLRVRPRLCLQLYDRRQRQLPHRQLLPRLGQQAGVCRAHPLRHQQGHHDRAGALLHRVCGPPRLRLGLWQQRRAVPRGLLQPRLQHPHVQPLPRWSDHCRAWRQQHPGLRCPCRCGPPKHACRAACQSGGRP